MLSYFRVGRRWRCDSRATLPSAPQISSRPPSGCARTPRAGVDQPVHRQRDQPPYPGRLPVRPHQSIGVFVGRDRGDADHGPAVDHLITCPVVAVIAHHQPRPRRTPRSGRIGYLVHSGLGHTYKSLTCGYALPGMVQVRKRPGHRHGGSSPSRTPALCPCRDDASTAADPIEARLTPTPLSTAIRKSGWVALFLRAGGHQIWLFREFCVLVTLGAS